MDKISDLWCSLNVRRYRRACVFIGSIIIVLAVLGPSIGLYRLPYLGLHGVVWISRNSALLVGVTLCIAPYVLSTGLVARTWVVCSEVHQKLKHSVKTSISRQWIDLWSLLLQLCLASVVAIPLFWWNRSNLLSYIDGQYLLTLIDSQQQFGGRLPVFSTNPLQGLGDIWYFTNPKWIPEFLVARMVDRPELRVVSIHFMAFIEVFLAITLLSYWLNGSIGRAAISGWLAGLVMFPFTYPGLIYNVLPDAPQIAFLVSIPIVIVPLLSSLGRNSILSDALNSCAIVLLMLLHFVSLGLFVILTYPFIVIVGLVFLIQSRSDRSSFLKKMSWCAAIVFVLVVVGLPQILLGFATDTAFQFFPTELARDAHPLSEGSIIFRADEKIGVLVAVGGLVGAIYYAVFGLGRAKWFGVSICVLACMILISAIVYALIGFRGAKPIYYEYILWPIYPLFFVSILDAVWRFSRTTLISICTIVSYEMSKKQHRSRCRS